MTDLQPGTVAWVELDPTVGREQSGRRPCLVVAGSGFLEIVDTLVIVVPITSVDRGWSNHVPVTGSDLPKSSWAMTEQVRTVSRSRIVDSSGHADHHTLWAAREWIRDFLDLRV